MDTLLSLEFVLALAGAGGVALILVAVAYPVRARLQRDLTALQVDQPVRSDALTRLETRLRQMDVNLSLSEFVRTSLLIGVVAGLGAQILLGVPFLALAAFGLGSCAYYVILDNRYTARVEAYQDALGEAALLIVESFRVQGTIHYAIGNVAQYGPAILRPDFQQVYDDLSNGVLLDAALADLRQRRGSPILDAITEVLQLRQERGGNVTTAALERTAALVRRLADTRKTMRARQVQNRITSIFAVAAPWIALAIVLVGMPETYRPFYDSLLGQLLLVGLAGGSAGAYWLMNQIANQGITMTQEERG
ncbi:MAG: type II secretion system F family protein [Chloroflexi bacterium]|nr:type II secretion system F family protein [Chloroflexota bacterium]MBU1748783.1 type II secretion system F family protein [Chloroflexota bacterium]